jgi:hypothetical protein
VMTVDLVGVGGVVAAVGLVAVKDLLKLRGEERGHAGG